MDQRQRHQQTYSDIRSMERHRQALADIREFGVCLLYAAGGGIGTLLFLAWWQA